MVERNISKEIDEYIEGLTVEEAEEAWQESRSIQDAIIFRALRDGWDIPREIIRNRLESSE